MKKKTIEEIYQFEVDINKQMKFWNGESNKALEHHLREAEVRVLAAKRLLYNIELRNVNEIELKRGN